MAVELFSLAGLIVLTVVVTELLNTVFRIKRSGLFKCRTCGEWMEELPYSWAYQPPFEVWVVLSRYNLKPQSVRRFLCPNKHTISWYLPCFGERECEVLVTKSLWK